MNKKRTAVRSLILLLLVLILAGCLPARAESYDAGTMRLLRYEGEVEILDKDGQPRFVLENVRFASGETMQTGSGSMASVSLDSAKIVTLGADTRVSFSQESSHLLLRLLEGTIFLDVQEKLKADESLVIRRELASDRRAVEELTRQAFWNVNRPGCSEHFLAHALREHPDFLPELDFVMEERGELVGSIMFTRARLTAGDGEAKRALTFGPLSIRPDCQRRGLGKQLVRFALERARKLGFEAAVIFGNPENYVTSGFKGCRAYGVSLGGGVCPTALLVRELEEGALAGKEWVFQESAAYDIDEKAAEAFDRAFPPMEPAWRPSQELFAIYSRSRVIR